VAGELQAVYLSFSRAACDERALVLAAVNIQSEVRYDGLEFVLYCEVPDVPWALAHLGQYDTENRPLPRVSVAPRLHPYAWVGVIAYAMVLVGVAYAIASGLWPPEAFENGALNAGSVQGGQWWRAWTALTLHVDANHLIANLGGGVWFGYLAARQLGSGTAWFLIVTGAAIANLAEAMLGPAAHRAVGASTAVFTALGLMAAHSWRIRLPLRLSWARRWAPLIAGTVLLGWLGTAGENTDVVAHALGFIVGCLLGATAGRSAVQQLLNRVPQWLAGLGALVSLAVAWAFALAN
jgi:rhomboid protease GluP